MKCYKGFNKDLQCTPDGKVFQYEIGKEYVEESAELCNSGFHACEYPLDCFGYYDPATSCFCEVELDEVSDKKDCDSKRCGKRIRIGAEIGIKGIVEASVRFILEKVDFKNAKESKQQSKSESKDQSKRPSKREKQPKPKQPKPKQPKPKQQSELQAQHRALTVASV